MADILNGDRAARRRVVKERPKNIPEVRPELLTLLDPDKQTEIRERARKLVAREQLQAAEEAFFEQALEEERRTNEPEQEAMGLVINLPGFAQFILLDNRQYHHGHYYTVTKQVFDTLAEIMARSWFHEELVGEPNRKHYQKPSHIGTGNYNMARTPRNLTVSPDNIDGAIHKLGR